MAGHYPLLGHRLWGRGVLGDSVELEKGTLFMGWASGSQLAEKIIKGIKKEVKDEKTRERIYRPIIDALEEMDWDTEDEVEGIDPAWDKAMKAYRKKRGWDDEG